jgi:phenylalanyl-tRNA synthetase alpha chain
MKALEQLDEIKRNFQKEVSACRDAQSLEDIRTRYTGRRSELTNVLKSIAALTPQEKQIVGKAANELKVELERRIAEITDRMEDQEEASSSALDVTLPGIRPSVGTIHPISQTINRITEIFVSLGFKVAEGPEIETEFYNFEALNIPLDHPSRDSFDTFYIEGKHLLRSHTSNVQIHVMQGQKPPIQVLMPGRVYRPDAVDASHSFMFHQVEGLVVGKGIRFSDLKGALTVFCRSMFGEKTKIRLRPHFFPFTEPSAEVDVTCMICGGKGCRMCKGSGWLEILGAGMVDPKVRGRRV